MKIKSSKMSLAVIAAVVLMLSACGKIEIYWLLDNPYGVYKLYNVFLMSQGSHIACFNKYKQAILGSSYMTSLDRGEMA